MLLAVLCLIIVKILKSLKLNNEYWLDLNFRVWKLNTLAGFEKRQKNN